MTGVVVAILGSLLASTADAKPTAKPVAKPMVLKAARLPHTDANARVAVASIVPGHDGELTPTRESVTKKDAPLSIEEETARQFEKILRGPLRFGLTGLYVVDAHTGVPVFAANADDRLNPASNVKMISTATALELLGPEFRYPTRLLGPTPDVHGAIRGDTYLLGSYDPTLVAADFDDIAREIKDRGIVALHGDLVVGDRDDATRDGIYRPQVPIDLVGGASAGATPIARAPAHFDLVRFNVTAKTLGYAAPPRLTYKTSTVVDANGHTRVQVDIGGTIGKGVSTAYKLQLPDHRALVAAHALRAALRAQGVVVTGDVKVAEFGTFVGDAVGRGQLPGELGHHESKRLADIVLIVNKWSINWLADRVVMTAAALTHRAPPSMDIALDAMYAWLDKHANLKRDDLVVDTGSGLSYRTQISARELVSIVRGAGGFAGDTSMDAMPAQAWLASLSIAGNDGTLMHRFRATDVRGRIRGKTGTLSTAIALSGIVDIDPARPLAFSLVTNANTPLSKAFVRKTHEQLMTALCHYAERTAKAPPPILPASPIAVAKPPDHPEQRHP
ncbi:MAG: D-alanyl-D-alanine carboxypeptidase/D-alanyl-D-alanine-endopeptidase, partial [Proteobacteria bacterium]|nr:D-alanyl-D-alanine carboxypeptidase/D-alanyl-D-alanine-endopeptidase [Pseudomonadota bacterium]